MDHPNPPILAVTFGDPTGIGPEICAKAVALLAQSPVRLLLIGAASSLLRWQPQYLSAEIPVFATAEAVLTQLEKSRYVLWDDGALPGPVPINSAQSGAASFRWVQQSIELLTTRRVSAVTTAPISKHAWALAGHTRFPGHTEMFAAAAPGVGDRFAMFFHAPPAGMHAPGLNVILTSVHVPLQAVPAMITTGRVFDTIELAHQTMQKLGYDQPRIGVCGLNPHAGESGLLGAEEQNIIDPAVHLARQEGINVTGPHPADTIFQRALSYPDRPAQTYDCVVAMYHDQGLAPLKTLAWDRAVNMTVGLPFIRTSPDHGTAFDIAGQDRADPSSMVAAIQLALRMAST